MTDAIVRTVVRVGVTHRKRLEWTTAARAKAGLRLDLRGFYRRMAGGVTLACVAAVLSVWVRPAAWPIALPFLLLWAASPAVARWSSLPWLAVRTKAPSAAEARALRLIARRTWRFFTTFVGAEDHALPPDNFQEDPNPVVAHRTSPTNLGLYLLATVAARDFGWLGTVDTVERLEATLQTMMGLERFRGHFYNWYATRDLRALDPRYVSSVDSGNLAGHLITLAHACRELIDGPRPGAALAGIADAVSLVRESLNALADRGRVLAVARRLEGALDIMAAAIESSVHTPGAWAAWLAELEAGARMVTAIARSIAEEDAESAQPVLDWAEALRGCVDSHLRDLQTPAPALAERLAALAERAQTLVAGMDFTFLFDSARKLFSIGYRVSDGTLDPGRYDLLASEARLTSFLTIARGDVPVSHWFRLGRALTPVESDSVLVSWSGSMFEYLMPALVMRVPAGSLLAQTGELVVARQISYGTERGVPWGVSESGYFVRDLEMTYQYSNFGVPGLGLRRGLSEDVVVAPYATALAAMVDPGAAVRNFRRLADAGAGGAYGFYEALDYTPARLPEGTSVAIVRTYMAHHQGMTVVAIANALQHGRMRDRFHAEPRVQATELLLQERTPRDVAVARPRAEEVQGTSDVREFVPSVVRRFSSPHSATPRTHLLSNGRYAVMVTAAGSGYSRWRDLAITRWREDVTRDAWGAYLFFRDMQSGSVWSAGHQPSGREADSYEVRYSEEHAEFSRRDGSIVTDMTVVVSAEHDAEIRRISLTNLGSRAREIEVTSYAEIVLAPLAADIAHPAFQNLFVQTEFAEEIGALVATRRPRSKLERQVWAAHVMAVEERTIGHIQYETDRARFLGRGRSVRSPVSVIDGRPLSNTVGAVLDPIFSLRCRVALPPGETARVIFSTVVADSRDDVLDLADKYREAATFERAATLAWTQAQVQLRHLGIDAEEAHLFQRLANRILYSDPTLRPAASVLARNERGAPGLWPYGISGELPIVLVRIDEVADLDSVRQLLRAHEYWRLKLLDVDLVIVNEHAASYAQDLEDALQALVRMSQSTLGRERSEGGGRVYVLRGDRLTGEDRTLLQAAARAVVLSRRGSLADQVLRLERPVRTVPRPPSEQVRSVEPQASTARPELELFNGLGGFADGGREYVTMLAPGQATPAPWLNVIANESFGFQVSESGAGYTWS